MRTSTPPSRNVTEAEVRQTPTFQLTGLQVVLAERAARKLGAHRDEKGRPYPGPAMVRISRIISALHPIREGVVAGEQAVLENHGVRRNGKLMVGPDGVEISREKGAAVMEELKGIRAEQHEVTVYPVPYSLFEGRDIDGEAMADLGELLVLDDDEG